MSKGPVPQAATTVLAVLAGIGVSHASDVVEARRGEQVRVTTTSAPTGYGSSTGSGEVLPMAGPAILLGTLVELDQDAITVVRQPEEDRIRIDRTTISLLEVKRGRTRGRNALIGAGIGAALGLILAVIENSRCQGEFLCGVEFALPVLTTPAGALIGVAIPGNRRWVEASPPGVSFLPSRTGVRVAWSVSF